MHELCENVLFLPLAPAAMVRLRDLPGLQIIRRACATRPPFEGPPPDQPSA